MCIYATLNGEVFFLTVIVHRCTVRQLVPAVVGWVVLGGANDLPVILKI